LKASIDFASYLLGVFQEWYTHIGELSRVSAHYRKLGLLNRWQKHSYQPITYCMREATGEAINLRGLVCILVVAITRIHIKHAVGSSLVSVLPHGINDRSAYCMWLSAPSTDSQVHFSPTRGLEPKFKRSKPLNCSKLLKWYVSSGRTPDCPIHDSNNNRIGQSLNI
jgi:hypothetical protein